MKSPFKFLDSYERKDRDIFFGREKETDALYELVNQNRLVLLYGSSGTGKTSLIQCGLGNRFPATDWLPLFVRRGNNLNDSLKKSLEQALGENIEGELAEAIQDLYTEYLRPVYLIFDQFEEIFVLGGKEEQDMFIQNIAALNAAKLPCQVIFSLREEYLAYLYPFEQVIPTLLDRRLRVEPMNVQKTMEVIQSSCAAFNISLEQPDENARQIIDRVSAGRSGVSLPYLQVYLDRLYQEDILRTYGKKIPDDPLPALEFTAEEIDTLGDIGDVLKVFLQQQGVQIQEGLRKVHPGSPKQAVRKILNSFASLEGTKIPRQKSEISFPGLSEAGLSYILDQLQQSRILREEEGTYELAHDTLSLRIAEQRSAADIALLEAADLIQGRMRAFERTGAYLNLKELQLIENYEIQLKDEEKLKPEAWEFVQESQQYVKREENKRKLITGGVIAVLLAFLVFAGWQWKQARNSLSLVVERDMVSKDKALNDLNDEIAYQLVKDGLTLNSSNEKLTQGVLELAYYYHVIGRIDRADSLLLELDGYNREEISSSSEYLKKEIQRLAGNDLFDRLEARYYPLMVPVEGGTFWMGDSARGGKGTLHQVRLDDFEMGQFEVTVFQYELYLQLTGKTIDSIGRTPSWTWQGNNPMVYVDWYDATHYANWLSARRGFEEVYMYHEGRLDSINHAANGYRLPTEAEWEYAAGGGMKGRDSEGYRKHRYAGSDSLDLVGWYSANSDSLKKGVNRTLPVGLKAPNELGLYDMSGNVWEWCQDWNGEYDNIDTISYMPIGPSMGHYRVLRGGSWYSDYDYCRVSNRNDSNPNGRSYDGLGFRLTRRLP